MIRLRARVLRKIGRRVRNHLLKAYLGVRNVLVRRRVTGLVPVAVSLTTYGARIDTVALAIESIARGSSRPARLVLWLDDAELFAHRSAGLRRLESRGLEIRLTENFGPHTKYYPYVASLDEYRMPLVTADDDIMYPKDWLDRLYAAYIDDSSSINCHWASRIEVGDDRLGSYHTWPNCTDTSARFSNFGLGVSGVIYPPRMLAELAARGTAFRSASPTADDVWLHWVALRSGFPVRQISSTPRHFALIPGTQSQALMTTNNVEGSGNDAWIRGLYTDSDHRILEAASAVMPGPAAHDAETGQFEEPADARVLAPTPLSE